jgi:hypothetical protein
LSSHLPRAQKISYACNRASSSSSHARATNKMNAAEEQDDCLEIVN